MKPNFNELFRQWYVEGVGYFDNFTDAQKAIDRNKKNVKLLVMVNSDMKGKLEQLANERKMTVSEIVRQAIEKEVIEYGRK